MDSDNILFVADCWNDRVCVLTQQGDYLGQIDLGEVNKLGSPRGLTLNSQGHLLVACWDPNCVVTYEYSVQ